MTSLFMKQSLICICLFAGGISDLYKARVNNALIMTSFLLILGVRLVFLEEIAYPLSLSLFTAAVLFPLYKFRLMGAADIKIFSLILFAFPGMDGLEIIFYGLLMAAVFNISGRFLTSLLAGTSGRGFVFERHFPLIPFILFGALLRFIAGP